MISDRLARPGLEPLCDELARRWQASERPVTAVTLRDLDAPQRRALADLLGSDRLPAATVRLSLQRVCAALGVDVEMLREAVIVLRGPFANRAAARRVRIQARADLWSWLDGEAERLAAPGWSQRLRAKGVPGIDVERYRERLRTAVDVLDRLPADDVPLAGLACDRTGDPHALDHGSWLGNTILDAVAERLGVTPPPTAEDGRRLWSSVGVLPDGFSSTVLVLGLTGTGDDPVARMLRDSAPAGEPVALTESQLRRWPVRADAAVVYAFENPSILAQAARDTWQRPPLVCTSGWPNVASITLLRQLGEAGTRVRYHGDFDARGVEIAQMLRTRLGVEPWRMSAADYESSAARARVAIRGDVPEADWDARLAPAMRTHGLAVYEEDLRFELLAALRDSAPNR